MCHFWFSGDDNVSSREASHLGMLLPMDAGQHQPSPAECFRHRGNAQIGSDPLGDLSVMAVTHYNCSTSRLGVSSHVIWSMILFFSCLEHGERLAEKAVTTNWVLNKSPLRTASMIMLLMDINGSLWKRPNPRRLWNPLRTIAASNDKSCSVHSVLRGSKSVPNLMCILSWQCWLILHPKRLPTCSNSPARDELVRPRPMQWPRLLSCGSSKTAADICLWIQAWHFCNGHHMKIVGIPGTSGVEAVPVLLQSTLLKERFELVYSSLVSPKRVGNVTMMWEWIFKKSFLRDMCDKATKSSKLTTCLKLWMASRS